MIYVCSFMAMYVGEFSCYVGLLCLSYFMHEMLSLSKSGCFARQSVYNRGWKCCKDRLSNFASLERRYKIQIQH